MQLKGLLYRKLNKLVETGKKKQKKIEEDITQKTQQVISELESLMNRDVKKVEHAVDGKFNQILKNLEILNRLNKTIIEQNQVLINLIKKEKKIIVSV